MLDAPFILSIASISWLSLWESWQPEGLTERVLERIQSPLRPAYAGHLSHKGRGKVFR